MSSPGATVESFAQHGEDLLIWDYFGGKRDGFFIEVGANHPTKLSQTWLLEQRGWRGMLVEPLPQCCDQLREVRRGSIVCEAAAAAPEQTGEADFHVAKSDVFSRFGELEDSGLSAGTIKVKVRTLESLCVEHQAPAIDFLSIDVEGIEISVLRGFDIAQRQPRLVVLEDHLDTIDQWLFMRRAGYRLVKRTGCNNWWIPRKARRPAQSFREKLTLWNKLFFRHPFSKLYRFLGGGPASTP